MPWGTCVPNLSSRVKTAFSRSFKKRFFLCKNAQDKNFRSPFKRKTFVWFNIIKNPHVIQHRKWSLSNLIIKHVGRRGFQSRTWFANFGSLNLLDMCMKGCFSTLYWFFLKNKNILTIGVAFSFQKFNKIKSSNFDVKLNYILTEKGIF